MTPLAVSISSPGERPRVDGRRLRSERTRLLIIEAYIALLRREPRMPTAAQIAETAGCSVRSVFERFADLNALTLATADYALAQAAAEATARDVNADRPTRIRSHVAFARRPARDGCRCGAFSSSRRTSSPSCGLGSTSRARATSRGCG